MQLEGCGTEQEPCSSVSKAAAYLKDDTAIRIPTSSVCPLDILVNISSYRNIGIIGNANCYLQCTGGTNSGVYFAKVKYLKLTNISFHDCGALFDSDSRNTSSEAPSTFKFRAAVYIINVTNLSLNSVSFIACRGVGLAVYDTDGEIYINNCTFTSNSVPSYEVDTYPGGGGMLIHYTYCTPGLTSCDPHTKMNNSNSQIALVDCTFKDNQANSVANDYFFVKEENSHSVTIGKGGGLNIMFAGNISDNKVSITDAKFHNNSSPYGGGISILFADYAFNNSLSIVDAHMENNRGLRDGGAVRIGIEFYDCKEHIQVCVHNNSINITNVYFKSNNATWGGAVEFYSSYRFNSDYTNYILFKDCTWDSNSATLAAAVDIVPDAFQSLTHGLFPQPVLENCTFVGNILLSDESGILNFHFFEVRFTVSVTFVDNTGTAIYGSDGIMSVLNSTEAYFTNNTGVQGGAVALIGSSIILTYPNTKLFFINNTAYEEGGAIYYYTRYPSLFYYSYSCFVQYFNGTLNPKQWNVSFYFHNNTATALGHSIYATTILPCARAAANSSDWRYEIPLVFTAPTFTYSGPNRSLNIVTYIDRLDFNQANQAKSLTAAPGEVFMMNISSYDELNQTIRDVLQAQILGHGNKGASIDPLYTYTSDGSMKIKGIPQQTVPLKLQTTGARRVNKAVNVTLTDCPPGYILHENRSESECICSADTKDEMYDGISRCNSESFRAVLSRGYWAGYISGKNTFATGDCPLGFCGTHNRPFISLPRSREEIDRQLCGSRKRTGVLCGKCKKNSMAVYYHSSQYTCDECPKARYGIAFYILSELVPLTIVFALIIMFGISFTSGIANSFILFAQVLDFFDVTILGSHKLPVAVAYLTEVYQFIFGVFNLGFFKIERFSFCLWKGSTVLNTFVFDYLTVLYALIMLSALIFMLKFVPACYSCLQRVVFRHSVRNSLIQGISALLILSYAKCAKVSLEILTAAAVYEKGLNRVETVVFLSGETTFFHQDHLYYAIPAVVVLVLTSIPPLLLLLYPALTKFRNMCVCRLCYRDEDNGIRCSSWLLRFVPFLDSFQGCYRDNCRYFAGLYFVYRLAFAFIFAFINTLITVYMCLEVILIGILVLHAIVQPYEKRFYNIVDAAVFANLALINSISLYNCYMAQYAESRNDIIAITSSIQAVLVYLPLFYISAVVFLKLVARFEKVKSIMWVKKVNRYIPLLDHHCQEYSYSFNEQRVPFRLFEDSHSQIRARPQPAEPIYGATLRGSV